MAESRRVLVVDDEPAVRLLVRSYLERTDGCAVVAEVGSAAAAVAAARGARPDVVVLEVALPGGSGTEAIGELKRASPGCRVVVFSSDGTRREEALDAGADAWHDKASPVSALVDSVVSVPVRRGGGVREASRQL